MRITESSLRKIVKEEISLQLLREAAESEKITVGELRAAIKYAEGKSKADARKAAVAAGATDGTLAVLQMIPYFGVGVGIGQILKSMYTSFNVADKPKLKVTNPLWDIMKIDPVASAIIDDEVERDFIKHLNRLIRNLDDDDQIPNADEQLQTWLKNTYERNIVKARREN